MIIGVFLSGICYASINDPIHDAMTSAKCDNMIGNFRLDVLCLTP